MYYNEMYLLIENLKEEERDRVKELLNNNDIQFKEFGSPLQMFCWEEAAFRLEQLCEESLSREEKDKFIEDNREELCDELYNNDYVVDGDVCMDITNDYLESIKENLKEEK